MKGQFAQKVILQFFRDIFFPLLEQKKPQLKHPLKNITDENSFSNIFMPAPEPNTQNVKLISIEELSIYRLAT